MRFIHYLANGLKDSSGAVLASGKVTSYLSGTTTLETLYQDFDLTTPHANPLTLDANGAAIAYTDERVKLVITTSADAAVRTVDAVGTSATDIEISGAANIAGSGLVANSGQIDVNPDGTTLTIVDDLVKVADRGIGETQIEAEVTVTTSIQVDEDGATYSKGDADGTGRISGDFQVGGTGKAYLSGFSARSISVKNSSNASSLPLVMSAATSTHGLVIIRGQVASNGTKTRGEGFTSARNGSGTYTITFTDAFHEIPVVVACAVDGGNTVATVDDVGLPVSVTQCKIFTVRTDTATSVDNKFNFFAIGQRGV